MTTAFAHTVRGQWLSALRVQPAGFVLTFLTAALLVAGGWTLATGRWPRWSPPGVTAFRIWLGLLILLIAGWALTLVIGIATGDYPWRPPSAGALPNS